MANEMEALFNSQLFEDQMQVLNDLSHAVITFWFIGLTMTTQVYSYHPIGDRELIELILPLSGLSAIPMQEDYRP
jgi:hypothetical protein